MMMSNDDDTSGNNDDSRAEIHLLRVQNQLVVIGWINCKIYYHKKSKRFINILNLRRRVYVCV